MQLDTRQLKKIIGFKPTKSQAYILENLKRLNSVIGGRRAGKSFLVAYILLRQLMSNNQTIWLVVPTFSLSKGPWNQLCTWIGRHFSDVFVINKSDMTITNRVTKSVLTAKSADSPVSLKGTGLSLLVIDEVGDIDEDVWTMYLRANVAEQREELGGQLGRVLLTGNAPHNTHWAARFHNDPAPDKFCYHLPTAIEDPDGKIQASNNPDIISVEELKKIKESVSQRIWNQHYLALTISGEGTVFKNVRDCILEELNKGKPPQPGHTYSIGADLGRLQDATCISVIDRETFELVAFRRLVATDWHEQKDIIIHLHNYYKRGKVKLDATGLGDPILEDLRRAGVFIEGIQFNNENKGNMVEKLNLYLEDRRIYIPNDETLIKELESYSYKMSSTGKVIYNAPAPLHDDAVVSLMLATSELPAHACIPVGQGQISAIQRAKDRMLTRTMKPAPRKRRQNEYI